MYGNCSIWGHPDSAKMDQMVAAMRYGGPDDREAYFDSKISISMVRLVAIELKPSITFVPFLPAKSVITWHLQNRFLALRMLSADLLMKLDSPIIPPDDTSAIESALAVLLDS